MSEKIKERMDTPYHGGSAHWWPPEGDHVILYKANPLRFEYFDRFFGDWENARILDVGCGGGYACEFLARRRAIVSGTDLMTEALDQARSHAAREGLPIEYRQCTADRIPFDDQSMDAIVCVDVIEHIPAKDKTLAEIHRVLKPGGWLFFDTFNQTFWSKLFIIWLGEKIVRFIPEGTHHWPLFIRPEALTCLLERSGFGRVELGGLAFDRAARERHGFPFSISPKGNRKVIYFGAAQKSGGDSDELQ